MVVYCFIKAMHTMSYNDCHDNAMAAASTTDNDDRIKLSIVLKGLLKENRGAKVGARVGAGYKERREKPPDLAGLFSAVAEVQGSPIIRLSNDTHTID